jgi:putative heme-binding domain-containing protein
LSREAANNIRADFPSEDDRFNMEASRVMAMLEIDDPATIRKVYARINNKSHPTQDFHYLAVIAQMGAVRDETYTGVLAEALLGLGKKLTQQNVVVESNWPPRFAELVGELIRVYPALDEALAVHPDLARPENVPIAAKLSGLNRREAARRFLTTVRDDGEFPISDALIDLFSLLPTEDVRPILRRRWNDRSARDAIVGYLGIHPDELDRSKIIVHLESASPETLKASLAGLLEMPQGIPAKELVPILARLRASFSEPKEVAIRRQIVAVLNQHMGQRFRISDGENDAKTTALNYRPVFAWFEKAHPEEAKRLSAAGDDEATIRKLLPTVNWEAGNVERGRTLYRDRGCQTCHGGSMRLGPDLKGVARRLSRDDLLTSILNPSRDVSPAYRVTNFDTKDGKRINGVLVYDSNEAVIVQTSAAETRRIAALEIESRTPSAKSLMPDGLLKGLKPEDLADLLAFLAKQ